MVVIAGGGFAGLEAAIQIKTLRPACAVVLISPGPNLVYKPWLIYVPAGRRRFAETCLPLAPMAARYGFQLNWYVSLPTRLQLASPGTQLDDWRTSHM